MQSITVSYEVVRIKIKEISIKNADIVYGNRYKNIMAGWKNRKIGNFIGINKDR